MRGQISPQFKIKWPNKGTAFKRNGSMGPLFRVGSTKEWDQQNSGSQDRWAQSHEWDLQLPTRNGCCAGWGEPAPRAPWLRRSPGGEPRGVSAGEDPAAGAPQPPPRPLLSENGATTPSQEA